MNHRRIVSQKLSRSLLVLSLLGLTHCAITATRPTQNMSNTAAAIRAAKEVRADLFAPELFRQSREEFFKAKRAYKFKDFKEALEYSDKARILAEWAEFEAIRNGGVREKAPADPLESEDSQNPNAPPTEEAPPAPPAAEAEGIYFEDYGNQKSGDNAPLPATPPPADDSKASIQ